MSHWPSFKRNILWLLGRTIFFTVKSCPHSIKEHFSSTIPWSTSSIGTILFILNTLKFINGITNMFWNKTTSTVNMFGHGLTRCGLCRTALCGWKESSKTRRTTTVLAAQTNGSKFSILVWTKAIRFLETTGFHLSKCTPQTVRHETSILTKDQFASPQQCVIINFWVFFKKWRFLFLKKTLSFVPAISSRNGTKVVLLQGKSVTELVVMRQNAWMERICQ